jgi:Arc/MetJ-type ribon-helix-helix transcriptional regulator
MASAKSPPEKTTVNIRMTETFLEDIDATWEEEGFNSRSEYIRTVLRDALKHPDFNRADLKAMLAGEVEIQQGRTHSSDDVKAALESDEASHENDE